jgi:uncharacterized protein YhaN
MRIERLALLRYGSFTDYEIDLDGDQVRLHVLLGVNEAGKTTALHAIGDLLFGIGRQTSFAFRHGYQELRIGATLSDGNGRRLTVRRRKGNQNTLLDADDHAVADDALAPFLGGADRAIFQGLFGLTHESLRAGGGDMLAARGDLGRMLFGAGSSMGSAIAVLDALEVEADDLFTPRRSAKKPFYLAQDARGAAERKVRELALRFDDWRHNRTALAETDAALAAVRCRLAELDARRTRLERIRRTAPRVVELREVEVELSELAEAPLLPEDAGERLVNARRAMAVAQARLEREDAVAAETMAALSALVIPEGLIADADEVQRLYDLRGAIADGSNILPELRGRRKELLCALRRLGAELGATGGAAGEGGSRTNRADADTAEGPELPAASALAEVRDLIGEDAAWRAQMADIGERHEVATADLAAAAADLAEASPPPDLTALALAVDQAQCVSDLEADIAVAERGSAEAGDRLAAALAALRSWTGSADDLAALAVPERETVQRFEREIGEAQTLALRARDALEEALEIERACERDLAALTGAARLATEEAVQAARATRDRGWRLIRRLYIEGEGIDEHEIETFAPRARLAERFEQCLHDADGLADRRHDQAAQVARHAQLLADREAARARRGDRERQAAQRCETAAALLENWRGLWWEFEIEAEPPREMDRWLDRREAALREAAAAQAAAGTLADLRSRLAGARMDLCAALERAGARACAETSFAMLVQEARARLDAGRAAASRRAVLAEKHASQAVIVDRERLRLDSLAERRLAWKAAWMSTVARVGLAPDASPAGAATALELWEAVRGTWADLDAIDLRIARIESDAAAFATAVGALVARVLPELAGREPMVAAEQAFIRLQAARGDLRTRQDLHARLDRAREAASAARAALCEARSELDALRDLAHCDSIDVLDDAVKRARRKAELTLRAGGLKHQIRCEAEGLPLGAAIAETSGLDPDALQSELVAIKREIDDRRADIEPMVERKKDLSQQGAGMEAARGAAEAEQARRNALAALEECSERWSVLKAAAVLLRRGVEQFRREQQGPLLARAESLFAALTLRSFLQFRIDYDVDDRPLLLAIRSDGTPCQVGGMSDGTRDQLFLALRLAAIERYLAAAEPLPFIADDLFVHFDDARARAGLNALIELGACTQVLLFTHHRHLAELAREIGGERVRVQELVPRAC